MINDGALDGGVQAETTLVRAQGRVVLRGDRRVSESQEPGKSASHLDTITPVHLRVALIVFPDHAELDNTLWDLHNVKRLLVFWVLCEEGAEALGELVEGLLEFGLVGENHGRV